jgi:hypothetical protein
LSRKDLVTAIQPHPDSGRALELVPVPARLASNLLSFLWLTRGPSLSAPSRCTYLCFIPSPRRSLGIGKTAGNGKIIYGAQQLTGKILSRKDLVTAIQPHPDSGRALELVPVSAELAPISRISYGLRAGPSLSLLRAALVLASSRRLADLSESAKLREWQNNPWGSITYGQNLEPQGLRAAAACFLSDSSDSFASAMMTQAGCGRIGHPSQEPWEACGKAGSEQMARSGNEEASGRRCAA